MDVLIVLSNGQTYPKGNSADPFTNQYPVQLRSSIVTPHVPNSKLSKMPLVLESIHSIFHMFDHELISAIVRGEGVLFDIIESVDSRRIDDVIERMSVSSALPSYVIYTIYPTDHNPVSEFVLILISDPLLTYETGLPIAALRT